MYERRVALVDERKWEHKREKSFKAYGCFYFNLFKAKKKKKETNERKKIERTGKNRTEFSCLWIGLHVISPRSRQADDDEIKPTNEVHRISLVRVLSNPKYRQWLMCQHELPSRCFFHSVWLNHTVRFQCPELLVFFSIFSENSLSPPNTLTLCVQLSISSIRVVAARFWFESVVIFSSLWIQYKIHGFHSSWANVICHGF